MEQHGNAEQAKGVDEKGRGGAGNETDELEAEQESAAAMDADVPQPPEADKNSEQ